MGQFFPPTTTDESASTEFNTAEPSTPTEELGKPSYEDLVTQLATAKAQPTIREAYVPQELMDFYDTDDTDDKISNIKAVSAIEWLRKDIQDRYPSAKTQEDIEYWLLKEQPDLDPSIPENLGLPAAEYNELVRRIDESKNQQIAQLKADRKSRLEAKAKEVMPAPAVQESDEVLDQRFRAQVNTFVDKSIAAFNKDALFKIEGYDLPDLDMAEVRKQALNANRLYTVEVDGVPDVMPDVVGLANEMRLRQIIDVLKPMADAYKRLDPAVYKKAVEQSLSNRAPSTTAPAIDPRQSENPNKPSAFGFSAIPGFINNNTQ